MRNIGDGQAKRLVFFDSVEVPLKIRRVLEVLLGRIDVLLRNIARRFKLCPDVVLSQNVEA
jgi:hypothetical protein